jgi:hypothetical protein
MYFSVRTSAYITAENQTLRANKRNDLFGFEVAIGIAPDFNEEANVPTFRDACIWLRAAAICTTLIQFPLVNMALGCGHCDGFL